jgi:hypothetical protein
MIQVCHYQQHYNNFHIGANWDLLLTSQTRASHRFGSLPTLFLPLTDILEPVLSVLTVTKDAETGVSLPEVRSWHNVTCSVTLQSAVSIAKGMATYEPGRHHQLRKTHSTA